MEPETILKQALGDRYEIQSVIGKGGMATVYKAIQKNLNRPVALKVVHQNLVHDEEFIRRFLREARVCASLNHPNVVTIYDVGSVGSVHFISMEYLEGMTLRDLINRKKSLSADETVKYIVPVADVLDFIHRQGIIHRDVKSSNIFITKSGRAVLMDFGIVLSEGWDYLTHDGSILGTPEYMSPEQAEGKIKIDGRSDIYSLGVVLFECLTGVLPFHSDNYMATLQHVLNDSPPSITSINAQVPKWISSIVAACLIKERSLRIPNGSILAIALRNKEKVKLLTTNSEQLTRKIAPGDIKNLQQKEVTIRKTITVGKNRNTILISLIATIAIIILILGLLTVGPLQIASNSGGGISYPHPNVSMTTSANRPLTQNVQPSPPTQTLTNTRSDPEAERKQAIAEDITAGDQFLNNDSCKAALSKYQDALHLDPTNSSIQQKIVTARGKWIQSIISQGDAHLRDRDYNLALRTYDKGRQIDSTNINLQQKIKETKSFLVQSLLRQGDAYVTNSEFNLAIISYRSANQIEPGHLTVQQKINEAKNRWVQSIIRKGDDHLRNHDFDLAQASFDSAKNMDPSYSSIISSRIQRVKKEKSDFKAQQVANEENTKREKVLGQFGIEEISVESTTLGNFFIGKCEVTQQLWNKIMNSNPSIKKGDLFPVENVSYTDIQQFLIRLNQQTNMNFRLPTVVEWEFAASGGNKSHKSKYSGSDRLSEVAWYINNSNESTHAVMSLKPNELGLYDMSGNVWEWCSTSEGENMVTKGGCWLSSNNSCAISYDEKMLPAQKDYTTGFRLCRTK